MKGRGSVGRITFSGIVLPCCISRLQNAGCRSLQELTGLRAPRNLSLQHGLCRGIDRAGREIRGEVSHASAIVAVCLGCIGAGERMQPKSVADIGRSRVSAVDRDDEVQSCDQRSSPMDRWRTALLGSAAAVAMLAGEPARAISINDQVAAAAGGIANYYDAGNQFPNVVSLFSAGGSGCTGSLINSRTILTAAHCFSPNSTPTISFAPIAGPGVAISSFVRNPNFVPPGGLENDIAVISLAQPVTNVQSVKLLTLQPGQPGFPTVGTTITMVGYGLQGTGSSQVAVAWHPATGTNNPPPEDVALTTADGRRRVATSSLGLYGVPSYFTDVSQPFYVSQFRNPDSPNNPNLFNLQVPTTPFEGGTGGGDSGGPLFAMINGQLIQIGVVRGGLGQIT